MMKGKNRAIICLIDVPDYFNTCFKEIQRFILLFQANLYIFNLNQTWSY